MLLALSTTAVWFLSGSCWPCSVTRRSWEPAWARGAGGQHPPAAAPVCSISHPQPQLAPCSPGPGWLSSGEEQALTQGRTIHHSILTPSAPPARGSRCWRKGQGTPSPASTFSWITVQGLLQPRAQPTHPSWNCFPHSPGLPAQISIPYLGRAGGEAENPHDTDTNNCKKQQGNGQDDPEGPGGSWEVCSGPPVLGGRQKKEEQELKLTLQPILLHQTRFQLTTQNPVHSGWSAELPHHCSTWNNPTVLEFRSSVLVPSTGTARKLQSPRAGLEQQLSRHREQQIKLLWFTAEIPSGTVSIGIRTHVE